MSEKQFAKDFEDACIFKKNVYFMRIHDIIVTREILYSASARGRLPARKQPCDGILVTPYGPVNIELKWESGAVKPHQETNCLLSNLKYPASYLIVREKRNKYFVEYHQPDAKHEILSECDKLEYLIDTIIEIQRKAMLVNPLFATKEEIDILRKENQDLRNENEELKQQIVSLRSYKNDLREIYETVY